ncbi:integrator complex subunit 7 [Hyalella azteca]|uniref:Integrator complex subunit 7 n=1 Tax=Hyalella azteca TaxID=294128 RepID=A0A8B7NVB7_HYAAZ|nr:integrator complex subunit 7 [Hyalella azteca]
MAKALARAARTITQLEQLCQEKKPIVECQLQLLTSVSEQLTGVPLPYPRLFYQSLQRTNICLNITPQPHNFGDSITLQNSSQLSVKVEGVISHGRQAGLFRSIKTVPVVTVDASVTDEDDETWQTGPRQTLLVKALEDPTNAKSQALGAPCTSTAPAPARGPVVGPPQQQLTALHQMPPSLPQLSSPSGSSLLPPAMPPPNLPYQTTPPLGMVIQPQQMPMQYHQAPPGTIISAFSRPPP